MFVVVLLLVAYQIVYILRVKGLFCIVNHIKKGLDQPLKGVTAAGVIAVHLFSGKTPNVYSKTESSSPTFPPKGKIEDKDVPLVRFLIKALFGIGTWEDVWYTTAYNAAVREITEEAGLVTGCHFKVLPNNKNILHVDNRIGRKSKSPKGNKIYYLAVVDSEAVPPIQTEELHKCSWENLNKLWSGWNAGFFVVEGEQMDRDEMITYLVNTVTNT